MKPLTPSHAKVLTLPWDFVQHDNHRHIPVVQKGKARLITAPKYRKAQEALAVALVAQWRGEMLSGEIQLTARCFFPDKRKRDAGNYRKICTDALTGIAYSDDSQLVSETWERAGFDKTAPRIEITITEAA